MMDDDLKEMMEPKTASLFVTNPDVLIEEDPNVTPVRVDCQSYVREKLEENYVYFMHPFFGNPSQTTWPSKTDKDCLHCCHGFDTYPVPIPRRYDDRQDKYYTFGIFCSVNCAKAYILEHDSAISTTRMLYFVTMCRNVFGIHHPVKPAPPRIRLQRFLGSLTIEEFRRNFTSVTDVVVEPPFIQNSMLIREQVKSRDKDESTGGKGDDVSVGCAADSDCNILPVTNREQRPVWSTPSMPSDTVSAFTPLSSSIPVEGSMYEKFLERKQPVPVKSNKRKTGTEEEPEEKKSGLRAFVTFL
jgi:hypothetical protein